MNKIKIGTGFVIFILFFGVAVMEAINKADWPWIVFWVVAGLLFLFFDNMARKA